MNMFNNSGQMNASDFRDSMLQLSKYAAIMAENQPSNSFHAGQPDISDAQMDQMIAKAVLTQEGKVALAATMPNPIRKNLDFQGIFRRALVIDTIPQGAMPVYERDIDVSAVVISSNGSPPESRVFGDRLTLTPFQIACNPTVRISEVRKRRFNVIDRMVQKARQELMAQEDGNGFAALDAASSVENTIQDIADTGLLKRDLVEIAAQIDGWDLVTSKFFMNINEFQDIRNWAHSGNNPGEIDPITQREIMQTGLFAKIWGADIMVSKIVPPGTVYACADPDFVGVLAIVDDIQVLPSDEARQIKIGFVVYEEIAIGILVPRGVSCGRKSVLAG